MSSLDDPRVLFAAERTLLAWNRTSLALIALGFLIERSGLLLQLLSPTPVSNLSHWLTFAAGLLFILIGAISALYATRQYRLYVSTLQAIEIPEGYSVRGLIMLNVAVALLGLVLIIAFYLDRVV